MHIRESILLTLFSTPLSPSSGSGHRSRRTEVSHNETAHQEKVSQNQQVYLENTSPPKIGGDTEGVDLIKLINPTRILPKLGKEQTREF